MNFVKSRMMPRPSAWPHRPDPAPRGMTGTPRSPAALTTATTSAAFFGTTTARGMIR